MLGPCAWFIRVSSSCDAAMSTSRSMCSSCGGSLGGSSLLAGGASPASTRPDACNGLTKKSIKCIKKGRWTSPSTGHRCSDALSSGRSSCAPPPAIPPVQSAVERCGVADAAAAASACPRGPRRDAGTSSRWRSATSASTSPCDSVVATSSCGCGQPLDAAAARAATDRYGGSGPPPAACTRCWSKREDECSPKVRPSVRCCSSSSSLRRPCRADEGGSSVGCSTIGRMKRVARAASPTGVSVVAPWLGRALSWMLVPPRECRCSAPAPGAVPAAAVRLSKGEWNMVVGAAGARAAAAARRAACFIWLSMIARIASTLDARSGSRARAAASSARVSASGCATPAEAAAASSATAAIGASVKSVRSDISVSVTPNVRPPPCPTALAAPCATPVAVPSTRRLSACNERPEALCGPLPHRACCIEFLEASMPISDPFISAGARRRRRPPPSMAASKTAASARICNGALLRPGGRHISSRARAA
eukprot:scaffold26823_cov83-Isochrysis_galbana.AAC.4